MADSATKLSIKIGVDGIPELGRLRNALGSVEASTVKLGQEFVKGRLELKKLEQSIKPTINSTRSLRDAYREMANQVEFGSRKFKVAAREADRLDKQLVKMERRGGRFGGARGVAQIVGTAAGAGVFGGFEGAAGALIGAGFGPAGAIVGGAVGAQVGQIRQAIAATAEYAAEIDGLRVSLKNVYTEQQQFNKALEFTERMTSRFNTSLLDNTKNFARLSAAIIGAGGDLDTAKVAFRAITVAMKANRKSAEDLDGAMLAITQIFSKGRVQAEELVGQLGERLPGAVTDFANATGRSLPQLQKDFEAGTVSLNDMVEFLIFTFNKYEEGALKMAASTADAGARMQTELDFLKKDFGDLFKGTGAGFQDMVAKSARFTRKLVAALKSTGDQMAPFVKVMKSGFKEIARAAKIFLGPTATMIAGLLRFTNFSLPDAKDPVDPAEDLTPGRFDTPTGEGDKKPSRSRKGRQDISLSLMNAQVAAIRETVEGKKLELEFEAKLLEIRESGELPRKRFVQLTQALVDLEEGRLKIAEKQAREEKKRIKEYDNMIKGFTLGNAKQFDMNAQVKQKTPFDTFIEGAKEFERSLGGVLEATKELAEVGFKGLGDAITELVVNGTLSFREFAASLLRDMARIIMQQIVVKSLMQAIGFVGGGVDSSSYLLSNTPQYNAAGVNIGSSGFGLPGFAKGGITRGLSIAGEAGPEAVVPLPDGRSIPVTMKGGGVGNVIVNVDASGTKAQGDDPTARRLGDLIGNAVKEELIQQKRPGGLLY